jgi:hypothetical protein
MYLLLFSFLLLRRTMFEVVFIQSGCQESYQGNTCDRARFGHLTSRRLETRQQTLIAKATAQWAAGAWQQSDEAAQRESPFAQVG